MIAAALDFICLELRTYLGVAEADVTAGAARMLAGPDRPPGVYLSVVNIHEDAALRSQPRVERGGVSQRVGPPLHLNIDLLFAFEFPTYAASLAHLSKTIERFQLKPLFSSDTQAAPDATPLPVSIEKLVFEMVNVDFEDLHHLWGALGTAYLPSVLYRVRLVKAQASAEASAPGGAR
ncbi:MAG: DUF4255 domain-containing protein [Cytophagaceae bacterium]|nr:DUF4255 domain-containing protein [Gemmatimonadaceae bacterium]